MAETKLSQNDFEQMHYLLSSDTIQSIKTEIVGHLKDLSKDLGHVDNRTMIRAELEYLDFLDYQLEEKA